MIKNEQNLIRNFGIMKWLVFIISVLLITDLVIFLNVPLLRQVLGFLFLTILPGLLILLILKLNKICYTEKVVLSVGLSISFIMFFGLLINNLSLSRGYETPLATIPLLISFNIAYIVLAIIGYKVNKEPSFSLPSLNLNTAEKAFLIVPIFFPGLSIFGMNVMNTTDNNIILMFLLFLIPIYVAFVCCFNHKFSKRLYPAVIFLISISLLLLFALRSNHIIGCDTHEEYYFFQVSLNNLHWSIIRHSTLDACLSISLLPTIYHSILNIPSEFLFKILYSLIYSVSPLVIYVLSKKYVGECYAFLVSCFFMFQWNFFWTAYNARTNIAILFFALAMMILFSDKIDPVKKRILFIVFLASCTVSHYATTYIFFFIILGAFLGMEIISKKYAAKNLVSLTIVIIFFAFIFFWYSQVTERAFSAGVRFIGNTINAFNMFFVEEARSPLVSTIAGKGITEKGIPHRIQFIWTWLTFALIGIGVITLIIRYKVMSFPELKFNFKKPDFLKEKFESLYFVIALACVGLLAAMVVLPHISMGYNLDRLYAVAITILSVFFVIGGIILAKSLSSLNKALPKKQKQVENASQKTFLGKKCYIKRSGNQRNNGENGMEVLAYLIILLILIPYFLCVTGVMYQMFDVPRAIILNSEGEQYDQMYIHDQESSSAKWLSIHRDKTLKICTDHFGRYNLISQGKIYSIDERSLLKNKELPICYVYFRKLMWSSGSYNKSAISNRLSKTNKIYDSDVAIYKKEK